MASQRTILVVEDDLSILEILTHTLRRRGYFVLAAADGDAALALVSERTPDIALLDMMLPGQSGFQLTQRLKDLTEGEISVVMMSGNTSAAHRDYALETGVDRFLAKPFSSAKVLEVVEEMCPPKPTARINSSGVTSRQGARPV
jgi:DNA-binding response OmpR family regulator